MITFKTSIHSIIRSHLQITGVFLLLLLAAFALWFNNTNSNRSIGATMAQLRFEGEYRIGNGQWQAIEEGKHISATKGDVTLRGDFYLYAPDGEFIGLFGRNVLVAFYTDHINLTFREGEGESYVIDSENPLLGVSACGVDWTAHSFSSGGTDPIEILVHNPHRFGNENAIDEMLSNVAIWGNVEFERDILAEGQMQRNIGLFFVVVALVLLGSALFSALIYIPNSRIIWLFGAVIISAGIYLVYSAAGVSFWSEDVAFNTSILGFSMMFYMLFTSGIITGLLKGTKRIAYITTFALGIMDAIYFLLPALTGGLFYDTWLLWAITQSMANGVLLFCMIKESASADKKERLTYLGMGMQVLAFEADVVATAAGFWEGGLISECVFFVLFAVALFVVLRLIPENINAAKKAKELEAQRSRLEAEKSMVEAELKESRISIMLSQIQPHFIYNTLGTIERMCLKDPEKAFSLVRNFSLYLRGNFSELDSVKPIQFSEELKHVEYYVNIEKVRFPDMSIEYDVESTGFVLPALSVQPLVENAIKHGLMRLETGGSIVIRSYETQTHFCVEVKDDGVGFDPSLPIDEKKHVGLRNIRGRLKALVDGDLILESKPGVGTKAVIMIPKE
ncbi:MAG: histidine kinase [Lachnospiraceae bacterium]|nr:histidine kinase [Lachnospiraceae bacterium]